MYLALVYKKSQNRYRKVLSTFIGTRTLIDLFMIIVLFVSSADEQLHSVLIAIVVIWRMCIVGYILKDALNVLLPTGILISIVFTIISIEVANLSVGIAMTPEQVPTSE